MGHHHQFPYLTRQNTVTAPAADGGTPTAAATPTDAAATAAVTTNTDQGFPADTPLEQMSEAQRTAYWKHYARRHEDTVKAFKGMTPQQVADLQARVDSLETEKLSADERALKAAKDEAAHAASAATAAEYGARIQELEVKSLAGTVLTREQLTAFMDVVDPAKLIGADGRADEAKVMDRLTTMFGPNLGRTNTSGPRWQNAGQYAPAAPRATPGAAGRAEAERRFGKKT